MRLFSYDSPFMIGYRKLVDFILLGLLWVVACIPVITFGMATTAMLLTAEIAVWKDEGTLWRTFWKYFRKEFKNATLLWVIQLPILGVLVTNVWLLYVFQYPTFLAVLILAVDVVVFCWVQLWFAYLSKFEDNLKTVLSNTFRITIGSFINTLLMAVLVLVSMIVAVITLFTIPPVLLFLPGTFIMGYTTLLRKLFSKYIPRTEHIHLE